MLAEEQTGPDGGDGTLVVRPWRVRLVAVGAAVSLVSVFTVVAVLLKETPTGAFFGTSDQVAMVLLGCLLAGAALLLARPRLRVGPWGLEIRNILASRTVEWPLVRAVTFPEGVPWARVELPDDEYIAVMAVQAADRHRAVRAMREVRRLHRRYTGAADVVEPASDGTGPSAPSR
ncbi:PH domain-containing protein [Actinoalloteichus spitiensis]|uniref:PH domain-containing protein n=1 Tax=Actinoalloteichus spitiensis TaxID=252394 RepID=UPI003CCAC7C8